MAEKFKIPESSFPKLNVNDRRYYALKNFNYPDNAIAPDKKDASYFQMWAEKIYHLCLNGLTWMPLADYGTIDIMRAYADGRQPTGQYKDWILGSWGVKNNTTGESTVNGEGWDVRNTDNAEYRRKAWANINTQAVSVAPKIVSKIIESIRSMYYEMSVKAVDSYSVETEETEKYRLWFERENRDWIETQMALIGLKPEEPVYEPLNLNELELYAQSGGFKVPYSVTMEDLLKHTFEVSDWNKEVAERIIKDIITLRYAIVKEEFDRELNRVIVKYVDPKYSGLQYSNVSSFKDSEYAYSLQWTEVSKIRQRLNMSYEEAASLAYAYSDLFGNPSSDNWGDYGYSTNNLGVVSFGFDFYKVPVFDFEFIDIDNEQYLQVVNRFGNIVNKKYNGEIQDNEKLMTEQVRVVRCGKWIIGTNYLYDYGLKEYIPRDNFNKPRLSYRAIRLNTIPIIEQIKPFLDGFNLAWIKLQDHIAKAIGNGFAIDVSTLKDVSIGKDKSFDPLEVLNYYRQSGFLLYRKMKPGLSGMTKVSAPPVIPLNNNMYDNIRAQFETMNFYLQKIEDVTGLSMVALGNTPQPHTAKFNMQASLQGTGEIINNISRAVTDLQADVSVNICYRIRSLCRVNWFIRESYESVVGKQRMKAVVDAEKNHVEYGITIFAKDITEEKQSIVNMLGGSIKAPGSNEVGKLDVSDAIVIQDMIMQGQNFRRIGLILGYKMRKKEQEARAITQQNIELQGQQLQQPELIKMEAQKQQNAFEMQKLDKEFYYDYTIKWGVPPGSLPPEQLTGNK